MCIYVWEKDRGRDRERQTELTTTGECTYFNPINVFPQMSSEPMRLTSPHQIYNMLRITHLTNSTYNMHVQGLFYSK